MGTQSESLNEILESADGAKLDAVLEDLAYDTVNCTWTGTGRRPNTKRMGRQKRIAFLVETIGVDELVDSLRFYLDVPVAA